jgi:hypothetical protein
LLFSRDHGREKQRDQLGGGGIADGETQAKNASGNGPGTTFAILNRAAAENSLKLARKQSDNFSTFPSKNNSLKNTLIVVCNYIWLYTSYKIVPDTHFVTSIHARSKAHWHKKLQQNCSLQLAEKSWPQKYPYHYELY